VVEDFFPDCVVEEVDCVLLGDRARALVARGRLVELVARHHAIPVPVVGPRQSARSRGPAITCKTCGDRRGYATTPAGSRAPR